MPEGHVLEPDYRGRSDDARQSADALGDDRVALVRHRRRALLALAERLLHLGDLGSRQVPDLGREALERGSGDGQRRQELRVPVALDDLRRRRLGLETQALAGDPLDLGIDRGVIADRARELSDPHAFQCLRDAALRTIELEGPDRELEAERRRLRMDAVRAADRQRQPMLVCPLHHRLERPVDPREDQFAGSPQLESQRGVHDIR